MSYGYVQIWDCFSVARNEGGRFSESEKEFLGSAGPGFKALKKKEPRSFQEVLRGPTFN